MVWHHNVPAATRCDRISNAPQDSDWNDMTAADTSDGDILSQQEALAEKC
jgi:hypothetical protein